MFQDETLVRFVWQGGVTMYVLCGCSILSWAIILEKWLVFRKIAAKTLHDCKLNMLNHLKRGDWQQALLGCQQTKAKLPITKAFQLILENLEVSKDDLIEMSLSTFDQEMLRYEKYLGVLATLGSVSPFIGLFGTVLGIIKSFSALSLNDPNGYGHVMSGIAEALVTTAGGLLVAVPAIIFYNYFSKKLKVSHIVAEGAMQEVIFELKKAQESQQIQHGQGYY